MGWRGECRVSDLIHGGRAASLQKYFREQEVARSGPRGRGGTQDKPWNDSTLPGRSASKGPGKAPQEVQTTLSGRNKGGLWLLLEKAMAPHSSTLAWKIPWMEQPGGLQSIGLLRVGHN